MLHGYKTRVFSTFEARIYLYMCFGGRIIEEECSTTFTCPFSKRALDINCRIGEYMPTRFCSARIEFNLISSAVDVSSLSYDCKARFLVHNYGQIISRIIRTIIFTLSINSFMYEDSL